MKKFFIAAIVGILIFQLYSFYQKEQGTFVLTWEGTDYFVKEDSLDYMPGHPDVAPEFSCLIAHNDEVHHYRFLAKGLTVLYIDGELYGDSSGTYFVDGKISGGSQKSRFIAELYESICNKIIHRR